MPLRLIAPLLFASILLGGFAPDRQAAEAAPAPLLTSEQALTRLLQLIRTSERVETFTPERLTEAFGVPVRMFEPGYWGFGEALSTRWHYGIEGRQPPRIGARFSFSFNKAGGETPSIDDICGVDYARFTAELEAMGFDRQPYYGEHGRFIHDRFQRPGMEIKTYPIGEPVASGQPAGRVCVGMVLIP